MLRQDPRRWLSNPVLHLERLNGARLSAKPPAMGTPVLHLNLGKVPVSVGGAYNSHARKDFEMSLIHGALSQLQPHVYSTGNLTRGRGWESSYQSTWVVVLDESDEGRATRQQVADMGFMTVAVSAASVHLPVSLHPGRIPLSLTRILISDLPVDFYRRGCTSEILECAGYTADKVAVVAEHGGELPGALAAAHPGVLRAGVVVAYVRAPADDPQLRRLPPYFMDRNHPILITLDIQNNTSSSSANPTTWQRPYRTPAPPPGRPAGAPRQASGPSRAQQETEGSRRAAQAARAAAAAATAAPLARGLAGGGSSAPTGAAAPGATAEGGGARAQSQAGPASLDPLDPGPQGTEPGGRAEALLRNVGWEPGTALGPDPRKGPVQKVWEVTEQRAPCHKGGLGNIPGPPGVSPDPVENPNSFFVLGEGEAGAEMGGAAEGGTEAAENPPLDFMGVIPAPHSLPDTPLAESMVTWLEDNMQGEGARDIARAAIVAFHSSHSAMCVKFGKGGFNPKPGNFLFRNEVRGVVRGLGGVIDEDEVPGIPESCVGTSAPKLRASCLLFLEHHPQHFSDGGVREKIVSAFALENPIIFTGLGMAGAVGVKPRNKDFRDKLYKFAQNFLKSSSPALPGSESREEERPLGPNSSSALPPSPTAQAGSEDMVESPVAGRGGPSVAEEGLTASGPGQAATGRVQEALARSGSAEEMDATPPGTPGSSALAEGAGGPGEGGHEEPMPDALPEPAGSRKRGGSEGRGGSAEPPAPRGAKAQRHGDPTGRSRSLTRLGERLGDPLSPSPLTPDPMISPQPRRTDRISKPPSDYWLSQAATSAPITGGPKP